MDNQAFTDIALSEEKKNGTISREKEPVIPEKKKKHKNFASKIRNSMVTGLEGIFYKYGVFVARHPTAVIVVSIIIPALLSLGMMKFTFDEDFADLLLPPTSRIIGDRAWVHQHVPYEQRPIRIILKNKNVLTKESMLALYDFHQQILDLRPSGGLPFEDLCVRIGSRCFVDSLLALWKNDPAILANLTDQRIIDDVNTIKNNPTYLFAFNASRMLGLMEKNSTGHIVAAEVMHADWFIQSSLELRPIAKKLEYDAIDMVLKGHAMFDRIDVFAIDSFSEEFFRGVYGDVILILYGFPVVLLYIVMALGRPNRLEHGVYMTLAAILGVVLSIGACFGIGLLSGFLFGAPHQALIFLLLAVGVDNAFVIMTAWNRLGRGNPSKSIEERIGVTMQHAGVSVTVTSFSDIVAFACGISTQMPVLRSFCVYCSIGILFLFLLQTTLFPACLTLNQRRIEASRDACFPCVQVEESRPNKCSQKEIVRSMFKKIFAPVLLTTWVKVLVILLTLGLAGVMGYGVSKLKKGFEFERSLPTDSYCRRFLEAQRLYFSVEGPGIQVFCGPMDYQKNLAALDKMATEYEESPAIMYGLVGNWIPLFKLYTALTYSGKVNQDKVPADPADFQTTLKEFFKSPFGLPFSKYIGMTTDLVPQITWSYFPMQQIVTQDVWENEHIMEEVRRIADNASLDGGKCFVYSVFHIFTEVIRYVDAEIMRNFLLAGVAVFVVTLILIVDFATSFFVLVCVVLTTVDIMGALQFWDFYLDVNLVVLLIISIGLAVDFSAHIGYTFMTLSGTHDERATNTLVQIGPAILHGAITTFLVFFVLIFGKSLSSFFAVFILVVLFGGFHGLCFLPVVLSLFGPQPYFNVTKEGQEQVPDSEPDITIIALTNGVTKETKKEEQPSTLYEKKTNDSTGHMDKLSENGLLHPDWKDADNGSTYSSSVRL